MIAKAYCQSCGEVATPTPRTKTDALIWAADHVGEEQVCAGPITFLEYAEPPVVVRSADEEFSLSDSDRIKVVATDLRPGLEPHVRVTRAWVVRGLPAWLGPNKASLPRDACS